MLLLIRSHQAGALLRLQLLQSNPTRIEHERPEDHAARKLRSLIRELATQFAYRPRITLRSPSIGCNPPVRLEIRNPFKGGEIRKVETAGNGGPVPPPARNHRWECGECEKRWLAEAGFVPTVCAERSLSSGKNGGCGSSNIGLAKNQPRVGDCRIRIEPLGDPKIPAAFQFGREAEDLDVPVVHVNLAGPRYIELRGWGSMSGQAQKRLKQYLVDVCLAAIAEYYSETKQTSFSQELGELYYSRMLRSVGIKQYELQVNKLLQDTTGASEEAQLATV
jgi:hypothetical protein